MIMFKVHVFDPLEDSRREFLVRAENLLEAKAEGENNLWESEQIVAIIPLLEVVNND